MPKVTFTQFCNELARVLGTHQHSKGSTKAVSVSAVGEETTLKSQWKCETKMSAQSSQIRDLHSKLDSTIMENSQMWNSLILQCCKPWSQTHCKLLNWVIAVMVTVTQVLDKASLSWAGPGNISCQLGRTGPLTLRRLVIITRIQAWFGQLLASTMEERLPSSQTVREGLNWRLLLLGVTGEELKLTQQFHHLLVLSLMKCFILLWVIPCH